MLHSLKHSFMKTRFYIFYMLVFSVGNFLTKQVSAQSENVGIGTISPEKSAVLDISSNRQGLLIPRMTESQRDAIASPAEGLLIYQYDVAPGFYYYLGGWQSLVSSSGSSANRVLSNLNGPTAVNVDLLPANSAANNLGSTSLSWKDFYFFGDAYLQGTRFISVRGTNNFFGRSAGNSSISAFYNTVTGQSALASNIYGNWNTANGYEALFNTNGTSGNPAYSNTGTGYQSLYANTFGYHNTGTGVLSLSSNVSGTYNSAIGSFALGSSNGSYNSAIGYFAGGHLPAGNSNTFIGALADVPFGVAVTNSTAIGYQAEVTNSNSIRAGNTSVISIGGYTGWTTFPSDGRFKKNVKENVPGLDFINQLRAVTYTVDVDAIDKKLRPVNEESKRRPDAMGSMAAPTVEEINAKREKASVVYSGFIAQEVEAAAKGLGYQFSGLDVPKNNNDIYGIRYAEFVVPLVKSVQELNKKLEDAEKEASLKRSTANDTIRKQQTQIDSQQKQIDDLTALVLEMKKEMSAMKDVKSKKKSQPNQ
jgi:uncharacterized coiled-coil protein SlyX